VHHHRPRANNGKGYLGRPWTDGGLAVFLDTKMGPVIHAAGWSGTIGKSTFAEFRSMGVNGNLLNTSTRAARSLQLTDAQALTYFLATWLSGPDNWNPASPVPKPASLAL
jgi:pectinesterase